MVAFELLACHVQTESSILQLDESLILVSYLSEFEYGFNPMHWVRGIMTKEARAYKKDARDDTYPQPVKICVATLKQYGTNFGDHFWRQWWLSWQVMSRKANNKVWIHPAWTTLSDIWPADWLHTTLWLSLQAGESHISDPHIHGSKSMYIH